MLDVDFTAYGSMVRRLAIPLAKNLAPPHVLDLVPFVSDVDLLYTGTAPLGTVHAVLRKHIPLYDVLRWQVRSVADDDRRFGKTRLANTIIPLTRMTLGERNPGVGDPLGARRDIETGRPRFMRNPNYAESPAFRSGLDTEAFAAFLFASALTDLVEYDGPGDVLASDGVKSCVDLLQEHASPIGTRSLGKQLLASEALRRRLTYLAGSAAFGGFKAPAEIINGIVECFGRGISWGHLDLERHMPGFVRQSFSVSAHISGDLYRLPPPISDWNLHPDSAASEFAAVLATYPDLPERTEIRGAEVVAASPHIEITAGTAPSSRVPSIHEGKRTNPMIEEMVHLGFRDRAGRPWWKDPGRLAAVCTFSPAGPLPSLFLPSLVQVRESAVGHEVMVGIRVPVGGFLERLSSLATNSGEPPSMRVYLTRTSAWKG